MCATCGCGHEEQIRFTTVGAPEPGQYRQPEHLEDHPHPHSHEHGHGHHGESAREHEHPHPHPNGSVHSQPSGRTVPLAQRILAKNDQQADRNRAWLAERQVAVVNLMSAPGSGKTTLLERTIAEVGPRFGLSVIEGDQETLLDGERIRATGCRVVQINTGAGCHLDADMMARGLAELAPSPGSLVVVENVGNLVCPALFDLGETYRVVVTSVTEGADKPLKYPQMFAVADLVLINKSDLLPYLDVEVSEFEKNVRQVNPAAQLLTLSATHGDGMIAWYGRLELLVARLTAAPP
ncbi:MAG: hydrogenase nickel incorporation protein HypB [Frankiales bacterium]|nr:hydrogenase nickel incorporation protein HypB [Frankiales bacterium]